MPLPEIDEEKFNKWLETEEGQKSLQDFKKALEKNREFIEKQNNPCTCCYCRSKWKY